MAKKQKVSGVPLSTNALEEKARIMKEINESLGFESSFQKNIANTELERLAVARELEKLENRLNRHVSGRTKLSQTALANLKQRIIAAKTLDKQLENQLKTYRKQEKVVGDIKNSIASFADRNFGFGAMTGYIMEADKAIRGITLELGLSGGKADELRQNLQNAATYSQRLGVSIAELAKAQAAYSEETNRTVAMSEKELKLVSNIGKGTALGVDQAAKLVGQFDNLGVSIERSEKFVQGVVDSSERLGINATKVLKNLSQNFKTLNTFSFRDGIKGMAKMSEYSEKFKLDINDSINSAKMARSLEGAIEMASQLNVLGGEFAKSDPFELLFLSRNDPAEYAKKLAQLTKGMATMRKTEDGFDFSVTAQDQDRLRLAADALGVSYENLAESARRVAQVQAMKKETLGLNLTKEEQEYIEGIAKFDTKTGKFFATINGAQKDISKLAASDIKLLKQEQKTLQQRAIDSQNFEEVMKNTMLEMKSVLLPVLEGVNWVLQKINKLKDWMGEGWIKGIGGAAITLLAAGKLFNAVGPMMSGIGGMLKSKGGSMPSPAGGGGLMGGGMQQVAGKGGTAMAGNLKAIGLAAAGAGVGIGAAAAGFGFLAKSLKDLNPEQLDALKFSIIGISIAVPLMAVSLVLLGKAAEASVVGIAIITGALFGIGAAIGIAGAGIGYMSEGLANLSKSTSGEQLLGIAGGIAAIGAATMSLGAGGIIGAIGGGGALAMILAIGSQAKNIERVGEAFKNIGVVLNANASQFEKVESAIKNIANTKLDSNSMFAELKSLLSKPLQVEFADKNISVKSDITLEINRERLVKVLDIGREAVIQSVRHQQGTSAARKL